MSGNESSPSGTPTPNPSGTPPGTPPIEPIKDEDKVLHSTHLKVLGEKKTLQTKNEDLQKKVNAFEAAEKEKATENLLNKGKYDEALKLKQDELETEKQKLINKGAELEAVNSQITDGTKLRSFLAAVGGDVNEKYWGLVDLDQITLDENGEPNKASVVKYAENFVASYGNEIISRGNSGELPPNAPPQKDNVGQAIKYVDWLKLPRSEMMKRKKDVID